ncbi:MAG: SDR family NAD(P)-dependent oxidoreductase, partial [Actinomycetes bacterium]
MRVVVMGGTSGIGLATAERLTGSGAEVIVTGRDPEKLAAVKDRVTAAEQVDGTSEEELSAFFRRTGEIDHLVLAFSTGSIGMGPLRE